MIKEPMFISPRTFRGYEQYKTDCARASGWNEAMAFIFAEELETERTRTIREKFFVVENVQTERSEDADTPQTEETCERCVYVRGSQWCQGCNGTPKRWDGEKIVDTPQTDCETCKYGQDKGRYAHICNECGVGINNYEPQTESTGSPIGDYRDGVGAWQTDRMTEEEIDTMLAKALVGQTDCSWMRYEE